MGVSATEIGQEALRLLVSDIAESGTEFDLNAHLQVYVHIGILEDRVATTIKIEMSISWGPPQEFTPRNTGACVHSQV